MGDKYELTDETCEYRGHTLHRIRALKDFRNVKAGDLGGWIEREGNLSQNGGCWVSGDAKIYGGAQVFDEAAVYDDAQIFGHANVCGMARVYGRACVCGRAKVWGDAQVYGTAMVCEGAKVWGDALVYDRAYVCGDAQICGDAVVKDNMGYTMIKNFWSSGRCITYTRSNRMWATGCFRGTGEELIKKAYADSKKKGKCYEAAVRFVEEVERERNLKIGRNSGKINMLHRRKQGR